MKMGLPLKIIVLKHLCLLLHTKSILVAAAMQSSQAQVAVLSLVSELMIKTVAL